MDIVLFPCSFEVYFHGLTAFGLMTCIRIGEVRPMHWYIKAKLSVTVQTMPLPTLKIKVFLQRGFRTVVCRLLM
jgi:hypothetical protein